MRREGNSKTAIWLGLGAGGLVLLGGVLTVIITTTAVLAPAPTEIPTPLPPSVTPTPTSTPVPSPTLTPTDLPSATSSPTDAPTETPSPTSTPYTCECAHDFYKCDSFDSHAEAQACFEYCIDQGAGDIHRLDGDNDGDACEGLP